jgi:hypothetical protein
MQCNATQWLVWMLIVELGFGHIHIFDFDWCDDGSNRIGRPVRFKAKQDIGVRETILYKLGPTRPFHLNVAGIKFFNSLHCRLKVGANANANKLCLYNIYIQHGAEVKVLKVKSNRKRSGKLGTWYGRMEDVLPRYSVMRMDVSELEVLVLDEANVLLSRKTMIDPTIAIAAWCGSRGRP